MDDGSPSADGVSADRLSELPDSLIMQILSSLPMVDVVRTSILSKRWNHLWTTTPFLDFKYDGNDLVRFLNFVKASLTLWNGTKIIKFSLVFNHGYEKKDDLDLWLNIALEKQVEELHINLLGCEDREVFWWSLYSPPQSLYSSSSITELSLVFCDLSIHGEVQWNQLKSLRIYNYRLSEELISHVLSGCPRLEVLDLRLGDSSENLTIRSTSLKEFRIEKYVDLNAVYVDLNAVYVDLIEKGTILTIWAPNLINLQILGCLYSQYLLTDVSSLSNVALHLISSIESSELQLRQEMMIRLLQSIHHAKTLALSRWCLQILEWMKSEGVFLPSTDATILNLRGSALNQIVDVLEMFPKLRFLVLKLDDPRLYQGLKEMCEKWSIEYNNSFEYTPNSSEFLVQLRRVEITWIDNDEPIDLFIEFLSKYGCNLEEIVFYPIKFEEHLYLDAESVESDDSALAFDPNI